MAATFFCNIQIRISSLEYSLRLVNILYEISFLFFRIIFSFSAKLMNLSCHTLPEKGYYENRMFCFSSLKMVQLNDMNLFVV